MFRYLRRLIRGVNMQCTLCSLTRLMRLQGLPRHYSFRSSTVHKDHLIRFSFLLQMIQENWSLGSCPVVSDWISIVTVKSETSKSRLRNSWTRSGMQKVGTVMHRTGRASFENEE